MLLMREQRKDSNAVFFVGDVAKKMGLKSSTYLKNLLRHLVTLEIGVYMIATPQGDYFGYEPPRQVSFFERGIKINGSKVKVADWLKPVAGGVVQNG
jgi:hypothetical protein